MTRPTLYIGHLSAKRTHGPGRLLCAMANPRRFERGYPRVRWVAPTRESLERVQRTGDLASYRWTYERRRQEFLGNGFLSPGRLDLGANGDLVENGDTLFCACARPGSRRRTHPCHLELLVPFLVQAGWDVVLDGRRVTQRVSRMVRHSNPAPVAMITAWADTLAPYDPAEFGWPEAA